MRQRSEIYLKEEKTNAECLESEQKVTIWRTKKQKLKEKKVET